jgi:hypothetical protein
MWRTPGPGHGPIDIIWWDYSQKGNEGSFWRADELMGMARSLQPTMISNNRRCHSPVSQPKTTTLIPPMQKDL